MIVAPGTAAAQAPAKPLPRIWITEPISKAGDYITRRAEEDLLIAISSGPQERNPSNDFKPPRLRVLAEGAA